MKPRNTEHLQCSPGSHTRVSLKSCITAAEQQETEKWKKENKAKLIMMVEPTSSRRVLLQYWWDLNRNRVWILCLSVRRLKKLVISMTYNVTCLLSYIRLLFDKTRAFTCKICSQTSNINFRYSLHKNKGQYFSLVLTAKHWKRIICNRMQVKMFTWWVKSKTIE